MESLQYNSMPPPSLSQAASTARKGSDASPSRSSFQSSNASRIHTPSTSVPSTPVLATRPASPEKKSVFPAENDNFLSALAKQERRVLELREELQKAEADLGKLKKQWAAHEAKKKRNEIRSSEQLQTLKTSLPEYTAARDESPVSANRELDRRKTLSTSSRTSQRKVFSGSRHTRTLSLLATSNKMTEPQYPPRADSLSVKAKEVPDNIERIPELDVLGQSSDSGKAGLKSPDRDIIIETGKQLVGDFRQGFWTFVEDLKQVTVGDQASPVGELRQSPKSKSHEPNRMPEKSRGGVAKGNKQEVGPTVKKEEAGNSNEPTKKVTEKPLTKSSKDPDPKQGLGISTDADNEGWDTWDPND